MPKHPLKNTKFAPIEPAQRPLKRWRFIIYFGVYSFLMMLVLGLLPSVFADECGNGTWVSGCVCKGYCTSAANQEYVFTSPIQINASDAILDCNTSLIRGQRTGTGINLNSSGNARVIVKNCKLDNLSRAIWNNGGDNWFLANNTITNSSSGIRLSFTAVNSSVMNNYFSNVTTAVDISSNGNSSMVANNTFINCPKAVNIEYNSSNNIIKDNYINGGLNGTSSITIGYEAACNNSGSFYLNQGSNYNIFDNNTIYYSGWNGIDLACYFNNVTNNRILYPNHHGIDLNSGDGISQDGSYNLIKSNNITTLISPIAIYVNTQHHTIVQNNSVYNGRITAEGFSGVSFANQILSNLIYNGNYSLYSGSTNNYFKLNRLYGASFGADVYGGSYFNSLAQLDNTTWENNYYDHNQVIYLNFGNFNYTFTEETTKTSINFGAANTYAWNVTLAYNGLKNFTITNNTMSLLLIGSNYSIFNITSGKAIQDNVATYDLTIGAGEQYEVRNDCEYPYDEMKVRKSTTFCQGIYAINPPTNTMSGINITANNVILDCNSSFLYGVGLGYGIYNGGYTGTTIKNCNLSKYSRGIYITSGNSNTIQNNRIYNSSAFGMEVDAKSSLIKNNYIYVGNISSTQVGLKVYYQPNATILSNYFIGGSKGIYLQGSVNSTIKDNVFENIVGSSQAIQLQEANYTAVIFNNISNTANNGIDVESYWTNVSYNFIYGCINHAGINILQAGLDVAGGYNIISNNELTSTCNMTAISIYQGIYNNISYNYIHDITGTNAFLKGIDIAGNKSNNIGNYVYSNSVYRVPYCIWSASHLTTTYDNRFIGCSQFDFLIKANDKVYETTVNNLNVFNNGIAKYYIQNDTTELNVSEVSTIRHNITLWDSAYISFIYNGLKNFSQKNYTVSILSMPTAYNDWFLNNQTAPVKSNFATASLTLGAGNVSHIFSRTLASDPHYNAIGTGITTITAVDYSATNKIIAFNCTGTGAITVDGLDLIKNTYSAYSVYHNNVFVEEATTSTYTTDGTCSSWEFRQTSQDNIQEATNTYDYTTDALAKFVQKYGIIIAALVAFIAITALTKLDFDAEQFSKLVLVLVLTAVGIVFLLLMLNGFR